MGKSYKPSGYQIISIDVTDKTSGDTFAPETEDEKILFEILKEQKRNKPVLLSVKNSTSESLGFVLLGGQKAELVYSDSTIRFSIGYDGTNYTLKYEVI